jgi:hypothetical protein
MGFLDWVREHPNWVRAIIGAVDSVYWAILLKPLAYLVVWAAIVIPIALLLRRLIPDGRVKRFLYKKRKPL